MSFDNLLKLLLFSFFEILKTGAKNKIIYINQVGCIKNIPNIKTLFKMGTFHDGIPICLGILYDCDIQ